MNLFKKMKQLKHLTTTEKILVDFIEQQPELFLQLKPKEVASKTYVSIPTIYRLVNKLGFCGINELKVEISQALTQKSETIQNIDYPILPSDSYYEVMLHLKKVYEMTIQDTLDLCDPEIMVRVSDLMEKSQQIDVYASSANLYFALNFQFQMQEINKNIQIYEDDYRQCLCAANSDSHHLALVISFGGRGISFKNICRILKENHTPIVLISSTENPLIELVDEVIYMSSYENHYNKMSSFSTRMTLLYILDTLYAIYFKQHYQENTQHKIQAYHQMTNKKAS